MILVTGATGHVGSELVRLLAEQGAPARALVHSPDKAAPIQHQGLETALGDFEQPDTLDVAMKGCDQLFLLAPPTPRQPQQEQHVIDAARRAGVGHVVKQSVPWAAPDAPVVFSRWHGQVEQHLAQSGLAYTLLRPSSFMQNFLMSAQQVADQGVLYGMFGEGRVAFIDTRDIAAVAAELLTSPGHDGASYTLTGPEALSAAEVAERLAAATGRQVSSVDLGADGYRQALAGAGMPGWMVDGVVE
ncbi:MAG TPA: SDR family oxidoreductase, partial [Actinomycetota bacterium]|nr:SDR family oxidoreductase [Actinomycetota bacterium]